MTDTDISVGQIASGANQAVLSHDKLRDALKATKVEVNAHAEGVRVRAHFEGFEDAATAYEKLAEITAAFKTAGSDVKGAVHFGGLEDSDDDRPAAIAEAVFFTPEEDDEDSSGFETTATVNVEIGDVETAKEAARDEVERQFRDLERELVERGGA